MNSISITQVDRIFDAMHLLPYSMGGYARTKAGAKVDPLDPSATSWDFTGAMIRSVELLRWPPSYKVAFYLLWSEASRQMKIETGSTLVELDENAELTLIKIKLYVQNVYLTWIGRI